MEPDSDPNEISEILLAEQPSGELLRLWKLGNEQAASILFDRYAIRLIALVANRMSRRVRESVDPEDVVQSAMGSFFDAARRSRIDASHSVSLWRLLATFARRKLARTIESQSTQKRGGRLDRVPLSAADQIRPGQFTSDDDDPVGELLAVLEGELPTELRSVLDHSLAGLTQSEIAESLGIDQRTVRRRLVRIRERLAPETSVNDSADRAEFSSKTLARIDYREFVIGKLIGAGGFGKVYRAAMQSDGSIVAVKFLRKAFWECDSAKQSFLREIETASRINHKGVARYLGWGQSPHGGPYVVTQWIDGMTLQKCRDTSPAQFLDYLRQIADSLRAVHEAGVVHGDLTPTNVLVDHAGKTTLTDFGFSHHRRPSDRDDPAGHDPPATPLLGGTLGFAAPEQISPVFGSIGEKTDLYAVGGLAFWYLTGAAPHAADHVERSIADTISDSNVDCGKLIADADDSNTIKRVAELAMKKAMSERPASIDELTRQARL